ncbi:mitogen-activated protein kinase kinase kinase 20-like [Nicotiana tomentosiformis]|uniref:mitogen-activated protein kinase kinase kinase 20-like n=1 Tax=Nicotiana tomentosiformis TaxID=4098 RepID=UPI00388CA72A
MSDCSEADDVVYLLCKIGMGSPDLKNKDKKKELNPLLFIEIARGSDRLIDDFRNSTEMDKLKPMKLLNCRIFLGELEQRILISRIIYLDLSIFRTSAGSLADRIGQNSRHGLQDFEVKQYAKSILLGLSHIHGRGFVHRDIKPDNILLVGTDKVAKIANFGFAKKVGGVKGQKRKHGLKGTPMYMAPESVLDNEYGPEADIWAFGCTVFEMVTGKIVWDCSEANNVVYLLCKIGMGSPDLQNKRLSKEDEDFLKKCLVKELRLRWTADML